MARDNTDFGPVSDIATSDHSTDAVNATLLRIRKHGGLSSDRVGTSEIDIRNLLQLAVVRRCAHQMRTTPREAVLETIRRVARKLPVTDRIVVDAELCLGLLREDPPARVDLTMLYGEALAQRRESLAAYWRRLHEALGAHDIPRAPSARGVRGGLREKAAFAALARLLTSLSDPGDGEHDTVIVVGDAVIDHKLAVEDFPRPGTAMWGADLGISPGGKGLNRAVGLARLELDARLLAAIGDDEGGRAILDYLRKEGVDPSLIRVEHNELTPVTTVLTPADGDYCSIAVAKGRTRLTPAELDLAPLRHAITTAAAVILTFEQPDELIEKILEVVAAVKGSARAPDSVWLVVNPSPPRPLTPRMRRYLHAIDYLVGTSQELAALRESPHAPTVSESPDHAAATAAVEIAEDLAARGVATVCVLERSRLAVHRAGLDTTEVDLLGSTFARVAGAASAFTAALTQSLVTGEQASGTTEFTWALAAMAASVRSATVHDPSDSVPDAMPVATQIEAELPTAPRPSGPGGPGANSGGRGGR